VALAAGEAGHAAAWPLADAALVQAAPNWAAQGQHAQLVAQLGRIPPARRSAAAWAALATALAPTDPAGGRDAAMRALELAAAGDAGLRLKMLTQVIGAYFQTFDSTEPLARWLSLVPTLAQPLPPDEGAALALAGYSALFLREPAHPELPRWQQQVQLLPDAAVCPNLRLRATMLLAKQAWYTGRHACLAQLPHRAQSALEDRRTLPYARLLWGLASQYRAWAEGEPQAGRHATEQALALAEAQGLHTLDRHLRLHDVGFALWLGHSDAAAAQMQAAQQGFDSRRRMEA
jgi:LuxR family transcriptional regulator, maltose regulon positive regulatory protein